VVLLYVLVAGMNGEADVYLAAGLGQLASWPYAPIMMARTNGQTVGHRFTQTRITWDDGSPATGGRAATREILIKGILFDSLAGFLCYIPTLLNYLWPLWDDKNEALHDKVCNTHVVRT
jgi:uncharacterized RDD family membrane protein YckC